MSTHQSVEGSIICRAVRSFWPCGRSTSVDRGNVYGRAGRSQSLRVQGHTLHRPEMSATRQLQVVAPRFRGESPPGSTTPIAPTRWRPYRSPQLGLQPTPAPATAQTLYLSPVSSRNDPPALELRGVLPRWVCSTTHLDRMPGSTIPGPCVPARHTEGGVLSAGLPPPHHQWMLSRRTSHAHSDLGQ
jgi:hypothetical protein